MSRKMPDNKDSLAEKFWNSRLIKAFGIISFVVSLTLAGVFIVAFIRYGPQIAQLDNLHFQLKKNLPVSINDSFAVNAAFDHDFPIQLKTDIPVKIPVSAILKIPINETFKIPLNKTFPVVLDKPFHIKDTIRVITRLPLDTTIETRVMGIKMNIPVKGEIPVDMLVPLDQDIQITGEILVSIQEPLSAPINQVVEAPINFEVKGVMPLNTAITAPIDTNIACTISIPDDLPVEMDLNFTAYDLISGFYLGKYVK